MFVQRHLQVVTKLVWKEMMSNVIELNFQTSLSQKVKLPYNVYHKKTSILVIYLFIILLRQNIHCDIVLQLSIPTRHYDMLSILILGKTEKKTVWY